MELSERFMAKVSISETGCWLWSGYMINSGYGSYGGILAHRYAYSKVFGAKLSKKQLVCHKCDVKLCVNPAHLFIGSHKDNYDDMVAKGRRVSGQSQKTHCPRGHELSGNNLWKPGRGVRMCRRCCVIRSQLSRAKRVDSCQNISQTKY